MRSGDASPRSRSSVPFTAAILVASVALVALLISSMNGNLTVSGSGFKVPLSPFAGALGVLFVIVMVALILLVFMQLISLILKGLPKTSGAINIRQQKRSILSTIIAIVIILIFGIILLRLGHPSAPPHFSILSQNITRGLAANGTSAPNSLASAVFSGLVFALFLPIIVTMLVIALLVLRSVFRREHPEEELMEGERAAFAGSITKQIEAIDRGKDPRMAVIEIYSDMRRTLGQAGAWDRMTYTPREFASGAVEKLGLSAGSVRDLTYLYEEAKFSLHPVTENEKEKAVAMLQRIVDELERR